MDIQEQIQSYISSLPESKRNDMLVLHLIILELNPACKLWFLDGTDSEGKIVSNPNIGYGTSTIKYANGKTKEFYQIGLSANTAGISVYILGHDNKKYLAKTHRDKIGKAKVTSYCINFKTLKDINIDILETVILWGVKSQKK